MRGNTLSSWNDRLSAVSRRSGGPERNLGLLRPELGREQADRYVLRIREACEALAGGRRRSRAIDDIRPDYRKLAVQSHVLFYRLTDAGLIDAVRILHQRMDAAARLRE